MARKNKVFCVDFSQSEIYYTLSFGCFDLKFLPDLAYSVLHL